MIREELELVLNQPGHEIEAELRREAAMSSRLETESAYNAEYPPLREAISSVDVTNLSQDASISAQIKKGTFASTHNVESHESRPVQSLTCLEFKIG